MRAKVAFSVAALAAALAACTPSVVVETRCPALAEYDQPFLNRLADDIDRMPPDSAALRAIIDYRQLRDTIRACKGSR